MAKHLPRTWVIEITTVHQAAELHNGKEIGCSRAFILNVSSQLSSIEKTSATWQNGGNSTKCAYRTSKAGKELDY